MPVTKKNRLNRASKAHNKTIRTSKSKRRRNNKTIRTSKSKRSKKRSFRKKKKRSSRKKKKRSSRKKSKKGNSHVMKGGMNINTCFDSFSDIKFTELKKLLKEPQTKAIFIKGFDAIMDDVPKMMEDVIAKITREVKSDDNKNVVVIWDGDPLDTQKFTNIIFEILKRFVDTDKITIVGVKENDKMLNKNEFKEKMKKKLSNLKNDEKVSIINHLFPESNKTSETTVNKTVINKLEIINFLYLEQEKEKTKNKQKQLRGEEVFELKEVFEPEKVIKKLNYMSINTQDLHDTRSKFESYGSRVLKYGALAYKIYDIYEENTISKTNALFIFYGGGGLVGLEMKFLYEQKKIDNQSENFFVYYPISRNKIEPYPTAGDYFINKQPESIVHSVDGISNPHSILAYSSDIHTDFMENYKDTFNEHKLNITNSEDILKYLKSQHLNKQKKQIVVKIITEYFRNKGITID